MLKACSRCGKIHNKYINCNAGRLPQTNEQALRNRNKWREKSKDIRTRSNYLCAVCKDKGIYNYTGLEVHHIVKLRDDPTLLLDDDNLICLCTEHHKQADAGQIDIDYLRQLVKDRDQ